MIDAEARAQLQARLREALQERLAQPLHDLFDELDAHLFDLADRSRSSAQSQLYYDALRLLRSERVQVETSFLDNANLALGAGTVTGDGERPAGPLRLVDIDELEETLTLEHQVQRISERLSRPLEALLARLAELSGTPAPERAQDSMISARGLSRMFRAALTPIGLNIEIRLIAFGLFGQHVLRSLASLYSRLNQILAEGGVLPELSETEPPSQRRIVHPSRRSARHRIPESGVKPAPPAAPPAPQPGTVLDGYDERLGEIHRLLRAREIAEADPDSDSRESVALVDPLEAGALDVALDRLWAFEGDPLVFKTHLVTSARRLSGQETAPLSSEHEDTVDLVNLLFSRIHADRNLPEPIRQLLARLHVPFLRCALRDPGLLHAKSHPARELLDELGAAGIGWCAAADSGEALLKKIALIVERLACHHDIDQPIDFTAGILALRQHEEPLRRRAELAEQRAVETVLGRERLTLARNRVASLLDQQLERHNALPWVRQLLRGPWSNHMALLWLRQGETSAAFREASAFVEELLWSDDPSALGTDPIRLARARDSLPEQLRLGLAGVTQYESEILSLGTQLREYLDIQLRGDDIPDAYYESDPSLAQADFRSQWREASGEPTATIAEQDSALLARLPPLASGTWVEFRAAGSVEPERGKLCWTSPYTGELLFVSRSGTRLREASPETLASEIQSERAFVIDAGRLLERTLRALVDELQQAFELPARLRAN